MAALTACNSSPSVSSLSTHKPLDVILRPNSFKPISFSNSATPNLIRPRLRVSGAKALVPKRAYRILAVSESNSGAELSDSNKDATIDIKLPRRSLLVQFTCDGCGERTQRLINRLAYERGLVYVQSSSSLSQATEVASLGCLFSCSLAECAGCLRHHKLVDNLGLVVEYDLREEISMESNTDQV